MDLVESKSSILAVIIDKTNDESKNKLSQKFKDTFGGEEES